MLTLILCSLAHGEHLRRSHGGNRDKDDMTPINSMESESTLLSQSFNAASDESFTARADSLPQHRNDSSVEATIIADHGR